MRCNFPVFNQYIRNKKRNILGNACTMRFYRKSHQLPSCVIFTINQMIHYGSFSWHNVRRTDWSTIITPRPVYILDFWYWWVIRVMDYLFLQLQIVGDCLRTCNFLKSFRQANIPILASVKLFLNSQEYSESDVTRLGNWNIFFMKIDHFYNDKCITTACFQSLSPEGINNVLTRLT